MKKKLQNWWLDEEIRETENNIKNLTKHIEEKLKVRLKMLKSLKVGK